MRPEKRWGPTTGREPSSSTLKIRCLIARQLAASLTATSSHARLYSRREELVDGAWYVSITRLTCLALVRFSSPSTVRLLSHYKSVTEDEVQSWTAQQVHCRAEWNY